MKIHCLGSKLVYQQLQVLSRHINLYKFHQVLPYLINPWGHLMPGNFPGFQGSQHQDLILGNI